MAYWCLLLGRLYAFLGEPYDGLQKWEEAENTVKEETTFD